MKFRKKPVVVEAVRFVPEVRADWAPGQMFCEWQIKMDARGPFLEIKTLEGVMRADAGDWIITGIKGERYPCKPDIFEATYEAAGIDQSSDISVSAHGLLKAVEKAVRLEESVWSAGKASPATAGRVTAVGLRALAAVGDWLKAQGEAMTVSVGFEAQPERTKVP